MGVLYLLHTLSSPARLSREAPGVVLTLCGLSLVLLFGQSGCKETSSRCKSSTECGPGSRCVGGTCKTTPPAKTQAAPPMAPMVKKVAPRKIKRPPYCAAKGAEPKAFQRGATHLHRRNLGRRFPKTPWRFKHISLGKGRIVATPVEDKKGTLYVGDLRGRFYAFSAAGAVRWKVRLGGGVWGRALLSEDDSTVWVGSDDDHLYALSTKDGAINWKRRLFSCTPKKGRIQRRSGVTRTPPW